MDWAAGPEEYFTPITRAGLLIRSKLASRLNVVGRTTIVRAHSAWPVQTPNKFAFPHVSATILTVQWAKRFKLHPLPHPLSVLVKEA